MPELLVDIISERLTCVIMDYGGVVTHADVVSVIDEARPELIAIYADEFGPPTDEAEAAERSTYAEWRVDRLIAECTQRAREILIGAVILANQRDEDEMREIEAAAWTDCEQWKAARKARQEQREREAYKRGYADALAVRPCCDPE